MPVARYFFWVGSVLVAMLLLASWYFPSPPSTSAQQASTEPSIEQTIRIQSDRKLPDKVVLDTSMPTIIPPSPPQAAAPAPVAATPESQPLEARAEMKPAAPPPAPTPPKRQARVHHRNPRPAPAPMWADVNPMQQRWSTPRWSWNW